MFESRVLTCEGQLVATAEVADTYGHESDHYDNIYLFTNNGGYELLVVGRHERYAEKGMVWIFPRFREEFKTRVFEGILDHHWR